VNLQTLSQSDYDRLLRYVQSVVPPQMCAAEEALSEGLIAALRTYDPAKSSLPVYVARCALNYARWQARKWSQVEMLSELEDENGEINRLAGDDPRFTDPIPEPFIERIEEILDQSHNPHDRKNRKARRKVLVIAGRVLNELRINANLGDGIGVDEYDDAPVKAPDYKGQFRTERSTREAEYLISDHLAQLLGESRMNVVYARAALRDATKQALHEGWLN